LVEKQEKGKRRGKEKEKRKGIYEKKRVIS
jgi:hypothetical protein